jgi:tetratricopeptide (TPR) repeat protein
MDSLAVRLPFCIAPVLLLLIAASAPVHAQAIDIRVTGVHAAAPGESPELSRQLAAIDAEGQLQQQAVVALQNLPAIKALNLPASRLSAFIAALVEPDEAPTRSTSTATGSTYRVDLHARLDPDDMRRRLNALRKDHDATSAVDDAWSRMQRLRQGMNEGRERAARALAALQLSARVSAALARTEENPGGGRLPSADGRARAKRLAETALALSPDSGDAHEAMGDVLNDADEPQAAEAEYRKALAGDPDSARVHIKLAEALRLQGKLPEAVTELRTALARDASSARAHSDLGMILRSQRTLTEAVAEQKEAIRLDPDYVEAHNELAVALAQQGRLAEAAAEFREMIRIDPDSAAGYFNLASVLADLDQDADSAAALREVVRINPNHYNAHYNLGELFRLEGKFDESVKQFREYLRLAPDTQQNRRNIQRARSLIEKFDNP